jgi:hypothetical protein
MALKGEPSGLALRDFENVRGKRKTPDHLGPHRIGIAIAVALRLISHLSCDSESDCDPDTERVSLGGRA